MGYREIFETSGWKGLKKRVFSLTHSTLTLCQWRRKEEDLIPLSIREIVPISFFSGKGVKLLSCLDLCAPGASPNSIDLCVILRPLESLIFLKEDLLNLGLSQGGRVLGASRVYSASPAAS